MWCAGEKMCKTGGGRGRDEKQGRVREWQVGQATVMQRYEAGGGVETEEPAVASRVE
jgi:hypothetical protein